MADPETTTRHAAASSSPKDVALKKALVVTDFSVEASAAIDHAVKLAKLAGMHLALLHVVEVPTYQITPRLSRRTNASTQIWRQCAREPWNVSRRFLK
jgi:universal stress protein family protein